VGADGRTPRQMAEWRGFENIVEAFDKR
jgi:hypothetical protein